MKLNEIDNIIFDLGGVILNLNYDNTLNEFKKLIPSINEDLFFGKRNQLPFFNEYEKGLISTSDFQIKFENYYQVELSNDVFKYCWNAMILDMPKIRIELIKSLKRINKKVFLFSNINDMHEESVKERYDQIKEANDFFSLFDKAYYSHHIGMRKPDLHSFQFILKEQNLDPSKTLFIDDSFWHIESAKKANLQTIHLLKNQKLENLNLWKNKTKEI